MNGNIYHQFVIECSQCGSHDNIVTEKQFLFGKESVRICLTCKHEVLCATVNWTPPIKPIVYNTEDIPNIIKF